MQKNSGELRENVLAAVQTNAGALKEEQGGKSSSVCGSKFLALVLEQGQYEG